VGNDIERSRQSATDRVPADIGERVMDQWTVGKLVALAGGENDKATQKVLREEISKVAADLAGPSPSPAERMLADVAALDWFALRTFEAWYAGALGSGNSMALVQSEHHQRRIGRAHRRLLTSLRTLATLRRLGVPAVQINVARRQVNISSPAPLSGATDDAP
jgi:hypothetical protein